MVHADADADVDVDVDVDVDADADVVVSGMSMCSNTRTTEFADSAVIGVAVDVVCACTLSTAYSCAVRINLLNVAGPGND